MAKKATPTPRGLAREITSLRKRIERAEARTSDLKVMVNALENMLDEAID